ncbi:reticulon-4 receptor-like 2 [Ptychodera flava]|uniref:reticulon-4 receptor-like 2 n=1 Tax=Ptychodera flava TaxID=63121 RepID=UPI00396A348C
MLDGLSFLKRLDIDRNVISTIADDTFTATPELIDLGLNINNMSEISSTFWTGLGKLQDLNLRYNRLQELKVDSFRGLTNMEHLELDSNRIQSIEKGAFNGLDHLIYLEMSFNTLTKITADMLTGLRKIDYINLSANNLSSLQENLFTECCINMTNLLMYYNQFEVLDPDWFIGLDRLNKIDLDTNKLRSIPGEIFEVLPSLSYLILTGNPLHCDCDMLEYRAWSGCNNAGMKTMCSSPDEYKERVIEEIPLHEFSDICISSCEPEKETISTLAWIGIVVGCFFVGVLATVGIGLFARRNRTKGYAEQRNETI